MANPIRVAVIIIALVIIATGLSLFFNHRLLALVWTSEDALDDAIVRRLSIISAAPPSSNSSSAAPVRAKPGGDELSKTPDWSSNPSAGNNSKSYPFDEAIQWRGRRCLEGTELSSSLLHARCRKRDKKGPIDPATCARILASPTPICGQWAAVDFTPQTEALLRPGILQERAQALRRRAAGRNNIFGKVIPEELISFSTVADNDFPQLVADGLEHLSSVDIVALLHRAHGGQRGLLFTGDSMMRQLWLRLIALIRGTPVGDAEHYFHRDALYILRTTGDELIILDDGMASNATIVSLLNTFYPGYLASPAKVAAMEDNVIVTMLYLWDIEPAPTKARPEALRMTSLAYHVASFMYWWKGRQPHSELMNYLSRVETSMVNSPKRFIYVTTPWTAPKTFGGVEDEHRLPRNKLAADWVAAGNDGRRFLLDYAAIAAARRFPKTADNIHYACIWQPKYPEAVTWQKYNGNGCLDPVNTAVVRWLMHLLLYSE